MSKLLPGSPGAQDLWVYTLQEIVDYLGLRVNEKNSMPVDGNENDIRIGGL